MRKLLEYRLADRRDFGCVLVRWRGKFNRHDISAHWRELEGRGLLEDGATILSDMRLVRMDVPPAEVRAAAETGPLACCRRGQQRMAVIAGSDLAFGMHRIAATLLDGPHWSVNVFRRVPEAAGWLGLPDGIGDPFAALDFPEAQGAATPVTYCAGAA